jgi:hypothetical protein
MANDVFDIATDFSIRYFNSTIGAFVEIVADSFEVDIDRGIEVEQGVFANMSVGTATVKLVKKNLSDFLGTPGYKSSDLFNIRFKRYPDTDPTNYSVLFAGFIQNVSMSYINESGTLEITITANDVMNYCMNQVLPTYSVSGTVTNRSFRNSMINLVSALNTASPLAPGGVSISPVGAGASATTQMAYTWVNEPAGVIFQRFLNAELGWGWANKDVYNDVNYMTRGDVDAKKAITFTSGNTTVSNVHFTNSIANGNFEVNTTGWSPLISTAITRVTSTFYMGVASARIANTAGNANSFSVGTDTNMPFSPGNKVRGSVWVKRETNSGSTRVQIEFNDAVGSSVGSVVGVYTGTSVSEWREVQVTGVAPAGTVKAQLLVTSTKSAAGNASIFMDNAKLQNLTRISDSHVCMDSIQLRYDSDNIVNRAVVIDSMTGARTVASNLSSINTNGLRADEFSVNLDPAGLSSYSALATRIANAATLKQVYGVVVPVIKEDGEVNNIAQFDIGNTLQVEFAQEPLAPLRVVSIISRINHVITPDHWEMNIGLWRGM